MLTKEDIEIGLNVGGVEAVDRAMRVMAAFTRHKNELSLHELSKRTGFYKSTLLRLLTSLDKARMIQRRQDKKFVLGPEVVRLYAIFQQNFNFAFNIRPVLKRVVAATGESASFYIRQGTQHMLCLVREDSPKSIRDHALEGDVFLLGKRANAGIFADFKNVRADNIPLEILRTLPYFRYGKTDPDLAILSAPVFSVDNSLTGILTVSGPKHRFTTQVAKKYNGLILTSAWKISSILGANMRGVVKNVPGKRQLSSRTGSDRNKIA